MIAPTSGVLIGVLGMARIPYVKWLKWIMPILLILINYRISAADSDSNDELNGF